MGKTKSNGIDLVVSFDTTGSMYPVLSQVRRKVDEFVQDMFNSIKDIRIGIVAHGDYCDKDDPYTIRILDLTKDENKIREFINTTEKTWGGDADECYELVLNNVRKTMQWEAGRTKILVMIGDASPHDIYYADNKDRIDWVNEAGLLRDLGVKIFSVHALANYRSYSANFYRKLAEITGGKYLKLDQFNEIIDLIHATCIAEYSEEQLNEFVSVIRSNGRMTRTMANNIAILSGKEPEVSYPTVQKDGLIPVTPGRFQVMTVDENCDIKGFVTNNGITFKRGRGFYELTKHETVQQYKEVIIQDRETGEMFTGAQVRERLGLQPQIVKGGVKESLSSRDTAEFRVFVQSTSVNRKLIGGTTFLYEVDDIETVGSTIGDVLEDKDAEDIKKVKKETVKKADKKVKKTEEKKETTKKVATKKTKTSSTKSTDKVKTKEKKVAIADKNALVMAESALIILKSIKQQLDAVNNMVEALTLVEKDSTIEEETRNTIRSTMVELLKSLGELMP